MRCGFEYTLHKSTNLLCFKNAGKFVSVGPSRFARGDVAPPVRVADFGIFGRRLPVNRDSPLGGSVDGAGRVILSSGRSAFDFSFVTLDCVFPRAGGCTCVLGKFSGG